MINPVTNSNAIHTAFQAMQKASGEVYKAAKEAASESLEAEKLIQLELAKKNVQIQKVNVDAAVQASETILDIIA